MPKFDGETPESIGNEVSTGMEVAADNVPVQGRAEMVVVLAQQGMGRNEISRRTGISTASVSRIAEANGISFDGRKVEVALKARIAELKKAQAGIALGLHEDIAVARMLLRTARTHRDYAFASKAIGDLTQAAQRMTPEISERESAEEVKDALMELRDQMRAVRDGFEAQYSVPFDSPEAAEIIKQEANQDES
ncbi:helix-turn-helix domain-containing protein [Actinacidiphila sp. bgisy145]|uniref:helix-turn-helix domain-containing protein n=1 Tax=Actinacidiphila sp. bgisy145 TaxID=3413792 RepID=UPI003EB9B3C6